MADNYTDDERDRVIPGTTFDGSDEDNPTPTADDAGPLSADPLDMTENDDGSVTVKFQEEKAERADTEDFYENLAESLIPQEQLDSLASKYLDLLEQDEEDRKERDKQYADGIKRTGLGNEAPGGADFEGASRAVHPVLMEGCIEFAARSMKELFPAQGPVKTAIIGEVTEDKLDKAERKKQYMNWQCTSQIKEYRAELHQTLTQVPLGGSQFIKAWRDDGSKRSKVGFIPIDEILLPYAAADFYCAERKTHREKVTRATFLSRVKAGLYTQRAGDNLSDTSMTPDMTDAESAAAKVEGKSAPAMNEDGLRVTYESYCHLELEDDPEADGERRPYVLCLDKDTRQVIGLYRNWAPEDDKPCPEELDWIIEFGFIPWRGAYKIGLAHIIGGLSGALTGALRAILDGGFLQSHPGGITLSTGRVAGKNVQGNPTEFVPLNAPPNVDDIRKLVMPYPYNGPAPVLFQLLDWLTNQAKGVVSTASEAIRDAGSDMPVGTALALIEQGSITFSSVHAGLHESQRRLLKVLHRLNGQYMEDEETIEDLGGLVAYKEDFQGPMDVAPVSDPNIFSDAQRYAQNQAAMAMAEKFPPAFKIDKLVERALKLMNYPFYDEVLTAPKPAQKMDAIMENYIASEPDSQLKAYRTQDHFQHLQDHVQFISSPIFCANPMMGMPALPKLLAHVKEHLLMLYREHARAARASASVLRQSGAPADADRIGSAAADQQLAQQLAPLMPMLEQAQKLAQQLAPKPPADPTQAALQVAQIRAQSEAQSAQLKAQADAQNAAQDRQLEAGKVAAENARTTQEMKVAAHNADLAAQSEQEERNLQLALGWQRESNNNLRAELTAQINLLLEAMRQGQENVLQAQNDANAKTAQMYTLFQELVKHRANLGESVDDTLLGQMQDMVQQPGLPNPVTLPSVPKAPPEPEGAPTSAT